jgi:hypothetical protein
MHCDRRGRLGAGKYAQRTLEASILGLSKRLKLKRAALGLSMLLVLRLNSSQGPNLSSQENLECKFPSPTFQYS